MEDRDKASHKAEGFVRDDPGSVALKQVYEKGGLYNMYPKSWTKD